MSAYITRKESKEAVQIAFVLGTLVGGIVVSLASAVLAAAGWLV